MRRIKSIAWFEIVLIVGASIAFSWIVEQTGQTAFDNTSDESKFVAHARALFLSWFGSNLVSAQGVYTCLVNLNGTRCQEYPAETCNSQCNSTCVPLRLQEVSTCVPGTCIDTQEGTCAANVPHGSCDQAGGVWDARPASEVPTCKPGCCLVGTQALYRTEQACNVIRERQGVSAEFRPVPNELACLALSNLAEEGACVLEEVELGKMNCKFNTKQQCASLHGVFYGGVLCSNTQLNTTCQKQTKTGCIDGKDEVYWLDSCGNKENIYDTNKPRSWNEGILLGKNASCALRYDSQGKVTNQASCGNCNYLGGSVCGTKRAQDQPASFGNYVCRDLSCVDEWGDRRKQGESWCMYDSKIGPQGQGNDKRSVDVPGSEHYRQSCINGETRTEKCGSARSQICVESRDEQIKFSTAACRINQWQTCMEINTRYAESAREGNANAAILNECTKHTDCYIKEVNVDSYFKFNLCVPKYPPGFDLRAAAGGEVGEGICAFGTQTCTYIKVKGGLFTSTKKYNKKCLEPGFAETMNNLCMSLGDCGAQVTLVGDVSEAGHHTTSSRGTPPKLSQGYLTQLIALASPVKGQHASPLSEQEIASIFGFDTTAPNYQPSKLGETLGYMGAGALGLAYTYSSLAGFGSLVGIVGTTTTVPAVLYFPTVGFYPTTLAVPSLGAFGGAATGLAMGAAIGLIAAKIFGINGDAATELVVVGAITGAIAGYTLFSGVTTAGQFASAVVPFIGIVVLIVVVFALILSLLGAGKKQETKIEFQCLPWQPPLGGAKCNTCGANGRECSRYQCQSLGQSCELVNEGKSQQACIDSSPNDVTPPVISPNAGILLGGYHYEQISDNGFFLRGPGANGCVEHFTQIRLGVSTNEYAQCKVANVHTANYDAMTTFFHSFNGISSSLFKLNHTAIFSIASNESIANEEGLDEDFADGEHFNPGLFAPDSSGNVNLYVRCTDRAGRKNTGEYAISFCVSPEPDRTAPIISGFNPSSPAFASLNAIGKNVWFYLNEPAECRWAEDSATGYDAMTNTASCATTLAGGTLLGWPCNATLPLSFGASNDKTYYFRCSDQPWVNETSLRNKNSESIPYIVKKTVNPLVITSVSPNNQTLFTNGLPLNVNLSVITSGGAEGARYCDYTWGTTTAQFLETGTDVHKQRNLGIFAAGNYTIPIRCYDVAGNDATSASQFNVEIDNQGPLVTRAYNLNGLNVITNEPATCAFSTNSCSFSFVNGTLMTGNALVHTTPFTNGLTRYVICRDAFSNVGACTVLGQGLL